MAFYYVRDHADGVGSATGDGGRYASVQTGDWDTVFTVTTAYYVSLEAALAATTGPAAGDFICFADIHDHNYNATKTLTLIDGITLTSVDDTAIDVEKFGAKDYVNSGGSDLFLTASTSSMIYYRGMFFESGDNLTFSGTECHHSLDNCQIKNIGVANSDSILIITDGIVMKLTNTDIHLANAVLSGNGGLLIGNGCYMTIDGGALLFNSVKPSQIFADQGNAGSTLLVNGFDMSNLSASGNVANISASSGDNNRWIFKNCRIPSGAGLNASTIAKVGQSVEFYSTNTNDEYYEINIVEYFGTILTDTGIYRDNALTYDGTNRLSLLVSPVNTKGGVAGIKVPIQGAVYADLSTSKTVTLYLVINNTTTTATTLTDLDIIMRLTRPDATNQALGIVQQTSLASPLKTGTNLTTSSEAWTGDDATNAKQYEMAITIPALTGVIDGRVIVEVEVMADGLDANDNIYICPNFDVA